MSDERSGESQTKTILPAEAAVKVLACDADPRRAVAGAILVVRELPVILDVHLAEFYETTTSAVDQSMGMAAAATVHGFTPSTGSP